MKRFWISWYQQQGGTGFELHSPWWTSGYAEGYADNEDRAIYCAAVMADSEHAAKAVILDAHDETSVAIEWRFCEEQADDWSPFNSRFRKAGWMRWPE